VEVTAIEFFEDERINNVFNNINSISCDPFILISTGQTLASQSSTESQIQRAVNDAVFNSDLYKVQSTTLEAVLSNRQLGMDVARHSPTRSRAKEPKGVTPSLTLSLSFWSGTMYSISSLMLFRSFSQLTYLINAKIACVPFNFYRAMHDALCALRGIARVSRPSVRPSVCL